MIVAIHQPNFFPWLGYFGKIAVCDCFVFLDNVLLSRQSYTTRVQLRCGGDARWVGPPIDRKQSHFRPIADAQIVADGPPWSLEFRRRVHEWYRSSAHQPDTARWLDDLFASDRSNLADFNVDTIQAVSTMLGFSPRFVRASSLGVEGAGTDLLVGLTQRVGGTSYVRGAGAVAYQEDEKFRSAGITPVALRYQQEPYPQSGPGFVAGLSVLDALFNCGAADTAARVRRNATLIDVNPA